LKRDPPESIFQEALHPYPWSELNLRRTSHNIGKKFHPLGFALDRVGLTPNILSALGLPFAAVAALYAYVGDYWWTGAFLALNLLFDILDGITARATGKVTRLGGFVDKVVDRYSWLLLFAGLLLGRRVEGLWAGIAIFGSLIRNYISQKADAEGAPYSGLFSITIGVRPILLIGFLSGMVNEAVILIALANNVLALIQFGIAARMLRRAGKP